jgi:hypothetical protein
LVRIGIVLAAVLAVYLVGSGEEDPQAVAQVQCAADAVVLTEYLQELHDAGQVDDNDLLLRFEGYYRMLAKQEQTIRELGYSGPYVGALIAQGRQIRDAAIADGNGQGYVDDAMQRVATCARPDGNISSSDGFAGRPA